MSVLFTSPTTLSTSRCRTDRSKQVADLHRDKEEALHLKHECNGLRLRMAGMEERCRHLEDAERASVPNALFVRSPAVLTCLMLWPHKLEKEGGE